MSHKGLSWYRFASASAAATTREPGDTCLLAEDTYSVRFDTDARLPERLTLFKCESPLLDDVSGDTTYSDPLVLGVSFSSARLESSSVSC